MRKLRLVVPFLVLLSGIGVGVYFLNQSSGFELRKKAAPAAPSSRLYFQGPSQVKIGEQFSVNLYLDTSNDPNYTVSGFDARITITNDPTSNDKRNVFTLTKVTPSPYFDSYPGLSEIPQQVVMEKGSPQMITQGSSGASSIVVSTSPFTTSTASPTSDVCPIFPGCDAINNWQLGMAFPACWGDALKTCPAPTSKPRPDSNFFIISGVKNYAVDEKGRLKGFTGTGVVATLTFVAERPAKATLQFVYTSPTATDDTNITGFLVDQPASLQKPQERLMMAPESYSIEVVTSVIPTPTPVSPTCFPEPPCAYEGVPDKNGVRVYCSTQPLPSGQTYCPRPTRTPTPRPPTPTPTVSPTPTPTPTPEPRVMINFRLALEGRKNHATVVDIYGMTTTSAQPNPKLLQLLSPNGTAEAVLPGSRLDKLGTAITDPSGTGTLSLDRTYAGATYVLFAQTPSHLRKAVQNYQAIRLDVGQNPVCRAEICTQEVKYVDFGTLTAGDVYTDAGGNKDNLINTFDVGAVFAAWSGVDVVIKPRDTSTFGGILPREIGYAADLNGDGVINNRDLVMLLANFNKRGDTSTLQRPLPVTTVVPQ